MIAILCRDLPGDVHLFKELASCVEDGRLQSVVQALRKVVDFDASLRNNRLETIASRVLCIKLNVESLKTKSSTLLQIHDHGWLEREPGRAEAVPRGHGRLPGNGRLVAAEGDARRRPGVLLDVHPSGEQHNCLLSYYHFYFTKLKTLKSSFNHRCTT